MKTIVIEKSRNYFKPIAILILILFILLLGFKFLIHPSEYISFLLRTEEIVIIFSIIGIIFCFLGIYIVLISLFRKNAFLKIDEVGIYDGFSFYKNKLIKWNDVCKIETVRYNNTNYLAIFLKKIHNNEKGINYLLYKMNELYTGTPYIISSGYLECSFSELEKTINDAFLAYKKSK